MMGLWWPMRGCCGGHGDGSVGFGGSDRRHGASGRLGGRGRGPQGVDGGGVGAGGRPLHRRHRPKLRSGASGAVLPFPPRQLRWWRRRLLGGTFLRSFTFGHVRQLDKAAEHALARAWSVGAAPAVAELTVDLDSTVCEVCGRAKHGAAYGHTKVLGYHPLVAVRADTGEVLHSRMRSGSSQRGHEHFARETLARVRRLAADASVTVRADSGFFSYDMIAAIGARGASYSITIPQNATVCEVKAANEAIGDDAWKAIAYTRGGEAQVAETTIEPGRRGDKLRGDDATNPPSCASSRGAAACSAPRASCGPTGATTASSPTETTSTPKQPTPTTETTPQSSSPSETSKKAPGSAAAPQDSSSPTAPGSPAACSRTTSPAGRPASGAPTPRANSPSRPPSATGSSPCRAASSTTAADTDCACRSTGPGRTPSPPPCNKSATCPCSSEPPTAPGAAQTHPTRHQPAPAPHPNPARPKTRRPAYTHQPSGHPAPTADPTSPSVDSGLEPYVTVSRHTAPTVRRGVEARRCQ